MRPHFCQFLVAGLFLMFLILATPQPVSAAIVFDDHFTGDSGGMPAGWYRIEGTGEVVEAGTTVTLGGPHVAIGSDATVDPSSGTVSIETDFVGIIGEAMSGLGVRAEVPDTYFICGVRLEDGRIEVGGSNAGGDDWYIVGYLVGYAGGPIRLTVVLEPTWFSVSTDFPPFSSGPIDYTTAFATFTRDDLGTAASAVLAALGDPAYSIVDRIMVDVEGTTPVESVTFGRIKALYRR